MFFFLASVFCSIGINWFQINCWVNSAQQKIVATETEAIRFEIEFTFTCQLPKKKNNQNWEHWVVIVEFSYFFCYTIKRYAIIWCDIANISLQLLHVWHNREPTEVATLHSSCDWWAHIFTTNICKSRKWTLESSPAFLPSVRPFYILILNLLERKKAHT